MLEIDEKRETEAREMIEEVIVAVSIKTPETEPSLYTSLSKVSRDVGPQRASRHETSQTF
jgi:hypothetical protein